MFPKEKTQLRPSSLLFNWLQLMVRRLPLLFREDPMIKTMCFIMVKLLNHENQRKCVFLKREI